MKEDFLELFGCLYHGGKWKLYHYGAKGSAKDDQGRGGLQHLANLTAIQEQANGNSREGNADSRQCASIHLELPSSAQVAYKSRK